MGGRFWLLIFLVFVLSLATASAQDLGSSNKLFGGSKKPAAAPAAKKAPSAKPVSKRRTSAKSVPTHRTAKTSSKTVPQATKQAKAAAPKPAPKPPAVQTAKVESVPVKPLPKPSPANPAADEFFERLIVEGNRARDDRNYLAAESAYRRAANVKSTDSRAIYGLGNLYSDQQRWEDAEKAYRNALKLDPSNAIIQVALSYVLSQPLMVDNLSDRYEEAEKLARRAIELAPSNVLAFDQLGVALELRGLISSETEDAYRNAIRIDPTFAPAFAHLGRLLRRRGMVKEAARFCENAVQLAADVPTSIVVADILQSEQRYAESEPLLRRAIKNDPKNPAGLLLLGKALTTLGNYADAEKFLNRSLAVSPNGFLPSSLLGTLYERQGKYELAENALLRALQSVSPGEKRNLSFRFEAVGDGYMKTGRSMNAARAYKQAAALDPERTSLAAKLPKSSSK